MAADDVYCNRLDYEDGEDYEEKGEWDGEEIYYTLVNFIHWCNILWDIELTACEGKINPKLFL